MSQILWEALERYRNELAQKEAELAACKLFEFKKKSDLRSDISFIKACIKKTRIDLGLGDD